MNKEKKIKLFLGSGYLLIVLVFLWIFFNNFSIQDFSSYELIKANRDTLEQLKNRNIFISCVIFFFGTIIWSLLLGFVSPILLISGFIFSQEKDTLELPFDNGIWFNEPSNLLDVYFTISCICFFEFPRLPPMANPKKDEFLLLKSILSSKCLCIHSYFYILFP